MAWPQQMFVAVNELLAAKGLVVKSGTAVDATIINAPSRPRTAAVSATRTCIRPRRVSSGTSA